MPTGGIAPINDIENDGEGGWSYVSPEAIASSDQYNFNTGPGSVVVHYLSTLDCNCSETFICIPKDNINETYECRCPVDMILSRDRKICIGKQQRFR